MTRQIPVGQWGTSPIPPGRLAEAEVLIPDDLKPRTVRRADGWDYVFESYPTRIAMGRAIRTAQRKGDSHPTPLVPLGDGEGYESAAAERYYRDHDPERYARLCAPPLKD